MGASFTSRFKEAVTRGDTLEAYNLYYNKKEVRDAITPNVPLSYECEDSVLHLAAYHGMRKLYTDLVHRGGKPDLKNGQRRNCLHLICLKRDLAEDRLEMLRVTLEVGLYQMDTEHVLAEKDLDGNSVLHLAAMMGLGDCVELLVECKADLFLTNKQEETAADWATKSGYKDIATRLETKMVFPKEDDDAIVETDVAHLNEIADAPTGMQDKDIRSMKDQLLIETAELLGISLFNAELLLRKHGWSKQQLLDSWMEDAETTCRNAGVDYPAALGSDHLDQPIRDETSQGAGLDTAQGAELVECGICVTPCGKEVEISCGHIFCRECWQQYLHDRIEAGESQISCPEFGCETPVPLDVMDKLVSKQMDKKFLTFDIKDFVESNPNMRWCPFPGCGQAVGKTPPTESVAMASPISPSGRDEAVTVSCGNEHYFCWGCGGDPHEPCDCLLWKVWLDHIKAMQPKIGNMTAAEADEAASNKWLATRSRPCPNCKAPIEKTEGCNHMCCKKCKYDFCWVCLDAWRCHNSSTGGYFDCNRYDVQKKTRDLLGSRIQTVIDDSREIEELSRFLHYYERYGEHKESMKFEEPYLDKAKYKMEELAISVASMDQRPGSVAGGALDLSFIEEAIQELLKARRVLSASYPFGYYITSSVEQKMFESLQASLEQVTEMLAEVVARPHLRKPRSEIIRLTRETREKRARLVVEVKAGLPLPMPTALTRHHHYPRRRRNDLGDSPPHDTFMEILEGLRESHGNGSRKSHDKSHDPPGDTDNDLLRTLEMSRQEFEENKQMNEDIELAKVLSMTSTAAAAAGREDSPVPSPPGRSSDEDSDGFCWVQDSSWPVLKLNTRSQVPPPICSPLSPNFNPTPSSPVMDLECSQQLSPVPPNGDPVGAAAAAVGNFSAGGTTESEWGPVYDEDEDLKRALELSLQVGECSGVLDSNRLELDSNTLYNHDFALQIQEEENRLGRPFQDESELGQPFHDQEFQDGGSRLGQQLPFQDEGNRGTTLGQPLHDDPGSLQFQDGEGIAVGQPPCQNAATSGQTSSDDFMMMELSGGQLQSSNKDSNRQHEDIVLPPELRHLLESSNRSGAHV